jgi:tetratricopeptide (TPR) repeat protein
MPGWWPFKRKADVDTEAVFRQEEAALRQALAAAERAGESRQALLVQLQQEAEALEAEGETAVVKAKLRAYDLLYSDLRQALLHNLSEGKAKEMAGDVAGAIGYYETAVADQVASRFPYEHLRVIYNRQSQYADALRVCRAALDNPFLSDSDHDHFRTWAGRFEEAT